jgi:hypothetical protein
MTGALSISSRRYDPPCKSKPKLIFLSKKSSSILNKFVNAIKINKEEKRAIDKILNFEK